MKKKQKDAGDFSFRPFEALKDLYKRKPGPVAVQQPAVKAVKPCSDEQIFLDAMKEVRKIPEYANLPARRKSLTPRLKKAMSNEDHVKELREITTGRAPLDLPSTQEYVSWINPAYSGECGQDIAEKLHRGKYSVKDYLDLHGYTAEEAEAELKNFLKTSSLLGMHCVKIIHGRGLRSPSGPVLKTMIIRLLMSKYRKQIIAVASARQCDGGLGAVYVLLKR